MTEGINEGIFPKGKLTFYSTKVSKSVECIINTKSPLVPESKPRHTKPTVGIIYIQ